MVPSILARPCASVPRTFKSDHGLQATVAPAPENLGGFECLLHDADDILIGVRYFDSDAMAYLYPHVPREIRSSQAYDMVGAAGAVQKALEDVGVRHFPWIETGVQS